MVGGDSFGLLLFWRTRRAWILPTGVVFRCLYFFDFIRFDRSSFRTLSPDPVLLSSALMLNYWSTYVLVSKCNNKKAAKRTQDAMRNEKFNCQTEIGQKRLLLLEKEITSCTELLLVVIPNDTRKCYCQLYTTTHLKFHVCGYVTLTTCCQWHPMTQVSAFANHPTHFLTLPTLNNLCYEWYPCGTQLSSCSFCVWTNVSRVAPSCCHHRLSQILFKVEHYR